MTRAGRMAPVQRVLGQNEQQRARDLGESQQRLAAAEKKLQDLREYRQDYERSFNERAKAGQPVTALRDFQVFLARLDQAIQQRVSQEQADRQMIVSLLHRAEVREIASKAGLSIQKAEAAASALHGRDLAAAAAQARQVQDNLAGGASTIVISTTTIIIVLLLIILIVAIAD